MRPVLVLLLVSSQALAQAPTAPGPAVVEEAPSIAVLPLRVEGLQLNEIQRINVQMRMRAESPGGFKVQSEAETTALVEATQSLGLDCDVNAVECGVRVGQIADVAFVLLGRAMGGLDGQVGIDVMLVDVKQGIEVRRVSALLPGDAARQTEGMNALATALFAKAGTPEAQLVTLALRVEPAGADIIVDGVPRGVAPLPPIATLAPGDHYVVVAKKGFIAFRSRIAVKMGEAAELLVTLAVDPQALRTGPTGLEAAAPWIVTGVGGVALIGGGVAALLAGGRYTAFQDAVARIDAVDAANQPTLTDEQVTTIRKNHEAAEIAAADWESWGQSTFVGGIVSAGLGVLAVAGGVAWGIVQLNDVAVDEAAAPPAPGTPPAR